MKLLDPEALPLAGVTVVEASAGTGKTYTITSLFLRLLLEQNLTVDQILVVTYTRAATAELRDRIRRRIALALAVARGESHEDPLLARLCAKVSAEHGEDALLARIEAALAGVDEAPILTIHGFCQRVLREHAFESGSAFDAQLTAHSGPLFDEIVDDYFMRELYATDRLRARLLLGEPAFLRELAARVAGRDVRVLPEHVDELSCDLDAFHALHAECLALWRRDKDGVIAIVRAVKGIGQNAVKWSTTVEAALESGEPGVFVATKSFQTFTASCVREKSKGAAPSHPFLEAADRLLALDRQFDAARRSIELAFRRRFVDYLAQELETRTRARSVRTFDALLTDLDAALSGPHGTQLITRLGTRYRAALVDEFQDTDPTQYRIFRRIFRERAVPLLLIGDPKQAIYGFRGADVAAYLAARREAGDALYTLGVNWRSDPPLIAALNALYQNVARPFENDAIDYQRVVPPEGARARWTPRDGVAPIDIALSRADASSGEALRRNIAREVARDIAALLARGTRRNDGAGERRLAASDIAVLCRTNAEAAQVQLALGEVAVPSVLSGDASVLDSDDVGHLERALMAMAHPGDARALRSFLSSLYGGKTGQEVLDLEADDAAWEGHRARFQRLHEIWLAHGFMQALRALVIAYDVEERLLARVDGTRRLTNLWHLAELLAEAALSERLGPLGLLRWLALVQRDDAVRGELAGDAHELRLESSDDAVTLTTVHKSKGLEYPIVYCPYLWDAAKLRPGEKKLVRFHDPARGDALTLDLGTPDKGAHEAIAEREVLAETLRLLYVALTRAKHRVTLVVPSVPALASSALAYTLFGGGDAAALTSRLTAAIKAAGLEPELHGRATELDCFSVRALATGTVRPYESAQRPVGELRARTVKRRLDPRYRVASFSALVARERTTFGEVGLDRDALSSEAEREARELVAAPSTLSLGDFPRGAVAGQLIHEVLEHAEFDGTTAALEAIADRFVRARGYPAELVPGLVRGLDEVLHTPLDAAGFRLAQLTRGDRIDEMEFVFPVDSLLSPSLLERVFRAHKAPAALPTYATELRDLAFESLHGFLRGYVDLVFRYEGRFYVVDYKSNWLGPRAADYASFALARPMADHHYFLQYHLYVLAVHRYLRRRMPDYDYERHFGGVYYLFLRGMAPSHPAQSGVFFDRPTQALVDDLDAALSAEREASP